LAGQRRLLPGTSRTDARITQPSTEENHHGPDRYAIADAIVPARADKPLGALGHRRRDTRHVANLVADPIVSLTNAQKQLGPGVLSFVHRGLFQIGAVAGFLAIACVLAFAAGWRQWTERDGAPTSAARLVGLALVASAGAMIIGYGIKGPLAIYLPGGINAHSYPRLGGSRTAIRAPTIGNSEPTARSPDRS
jgi:hypothetical protein